MIAASLTNCILHFKAQVQITLVTKKLLVLKKRWIVYTLPFMLDWLPGIYAQTLDCRQSRVEHHFRKIGSQIFGQKTHTFFWKMYFRRLEFSSVNSHNFNKNHEYFFYYKISPSQIFATHVRRFLFRISHMKVLFFLLNIDYFYSFGSLFSSFL